MEAKLGSLLQSEFEASLGYITLFLKRKKRNEDLWVVLRRNHSVTSVASDVGLCFM